MKTVKRKAEVGERVILVDGVKEGETGKVVNIVGDTAVLEFDSGKNSGKNYVTFMRFCEVIEDNPKKPIIPVPEDVNLIPVDDEGNPLPPHSSHYHQNGLDPLEVMRRTFPPEQYEGFLRGSLLKYTMRYDRKGQQQSDLEKLNFYGQELEQWKNALKDADGNVIFPEDAE